MIQPDLDTSAVGCPPFPGGTVDSPPQAPAFVRPSIRIVIGTTARRWPMFPAAQSGHAAGDGQESRMKTAADIADQLAAARQRALDALLAVAPEAA